ncbi:MAG: thermonuclease family protein [Rhizobium sp.]
MLAFFALGLLALVAFRMDRAPDVIQAGNFTIVDGDSLARGDERLRLYGIDAPEYRQQCQRDGAAWACGRVARDALARLLPSGQAECRGRQRDRYDRLLVTCKANGVDINAELVREGMAVAFGDYQAEEAAARTAKAGLWAGSFERPQDFRHDGGLARPRRDPLADFWDDLRRFVGWP